MNRVAWWACALIALVDARIYERCELARDLQALGVEPDNIATWVCIAYHESRFNTAAFNSYSGDHGLFQISELYWCGPGKACALPCSTLRDGDISDDLECALQVHEEHTRLQGNGFLAWVVYPQHCKHNTKKYLVDCDTTIKNPSPFKPRTFTYDDNNSNFTTFGKPNVEGLLPPYLAVSALFRGNYGKFQDRGRGRVDNINYKIDNIDELKLPVFGEVPAPVTTPRTTARTTTTTTTYIPPVKPWRTIETNQFRKKPHNTTTKKEYVSSFERSTPSTSTTKQLSTTTTTLRPFSVASTALQTVSTTTWRPFIFTTTTIRPITSRPAFSSFSSSRAPTKATTKTQRFFSTTTTASPWTVATPRLTTTTSRPTVTTTARTAPSSTYKPFAFTYKHPLTTTKKPSYSWYTFTSRSTSTSASTKFAQTFTTPRPVTTTTAKPQVTQKLRTTQNIFDLYLNPTKPPKLQPFRFKFDSDKRFRLNIFSDGTTTSAPDNRSNKSNNRDQNSEHGGASRNYIRRQTLESDTA